MGSKPENNLVARLDALPSPRVLAAAVIAERFSSAVAKTGKVTMAQLESAGVFGRKTIVKHIRSGILRAEKVTIQGRELWLFDPQEVKAYILKYADLLEEASKRRGTKPAIISDGYLSINDAAERLKVSHWTLRNHLSKVEIKIESGPRTAKMIAVKDMRYLEAYFECIRRRPEQKPLPAPIEAAKKIVGGLYFDSFPLLFSVMRNQPEVTARTMAAVTGVAQFTADRWKRGDRLPSEIYQGPLIAMFRQMFRCRLSPTLSNMADGRRRKYMSDYMARRRKEDRKNHSG